MTHNKPNENNMAMYCVIGCEVGGIYSQFQGPACVVISLC